MARPWLRLYRSTVNNPKIQRLSPDLFRAWVNILCCTDDDGKVPKAQDLAFALRVELPVAYGWLCDLRDLGLFDAKRNGDHFAHDWSTHNYESDVSTSRVKRFRERCSNGERNAPDTESDTDLDSDQKKPTASAVVKNPSRAIAWIDEQEVLPSWHVAAREARELRGLPPIDLELEADKFGHWAVNAKPKKDWRRAFINWCLNAKGIGYGTGLSGRNRKPTTGDALDKIFDRIAATEHTVQPE